MKSSVSHTSESVHSIAHLECEHLMLLSTPLHVLLWHAKLSAIKDARCCLKYNILCWLRHYISKLITLWWFWRPWGNLRSWVEDNIERYNRDARTLLLMLFWEKDYDSSSVIPAELCVSMQGQRSALHCIYTEWALVFLHIVFIFQNYSISLQGSETLK